MCTTMSVKILIVDDEENIRFLYERELQDEGYEIILARDGVEAEVSALQVAVPPLLDAPLVGLDTRCTILVLGRHMGVEHVGRFGDVVVDADQDQVIGVHLGGPPLVAQRCPCTVPVHEPTVSTRCLMPLMKFDRTRSAGRTATSRGRTSRNASSVTAASSFARCEPTQ